MRLERIAQDYEARVLPTKLIWLITRPKILMPYHLAIFAINGAKIRIRTENT